VRSFRSGAGNVLEGVGVTPDHEIQFLVDDLRQGRDAMIEAAAGAVLAALQMNRYTAATSTVDPSVL
jgi:C-terminal processing protease CtpA/Prc